jgi:hypothetical protein
MDFISSVLVLFSAAHFNSLAITGDLNILLSLGISGKCLNTFAGTVVDPGIHLDKPHPGCGHT